MYDVPLILVWHVYTVSSISILDSSVFCVHELTVSCCCRGLLFCSDTASRDLFSMICSRPVPFEHYCTISLNTSAQHVKLSAHDLSSCWSLRKLENWLLGTKIRTAAEQTNYLLGCFKLHEIVYVCANKLNSTQQQCSFQAVRSHTFLRGARRKLKSAHCALLCG